MDMVTRRDIDPTSRLFSSLKKPSNSLYMELPSMHSPREPRGTGCSGRYRELGLFPAAVIG